MGKCPFDLSLVLRIHGGVGLFDFSLVYRSQSGGGGRSFALTLVLRLQSVCTYIRTYVRMHVCMYVCICTHTLKAKTNFSIVVNH